MTPGLLLLVLVGASQPSEIVVAMERYACVGLPTNQTGQEVQLHGHLLNTGPATVLRARLSVQQPGSWLPPGVCVGTACFPSDVEFSLDVAQGASLDLHFSFYPFDTPGKGVYWFSYGTQTLSDSLRLEVISGVSTLLVDDDGGGASQAYLERAWPETFPFQTWDESLEPLSRADAALLSRLVWITGDARPGCLDPGEVATLASFLDAGGSLLLSGQDALEGEAATSFAATYLGVAATGPAANVSSVRGTPGTSFQQISFSIQGGEGANNQVSPDTVAAAQGSFVALRYGEGPGAGIAKASGGARCLTLGFGLEACAEAQTLTQVLDFCLRWLDGAVRTPDPAPRPGVVRVFPSPARSGGVLWLGLPVGANLEVALYDVGGRRWGEPFRGVWSGSMVLPAVPPGLYVAKVCGEIQATVPVAVGR